jgi:diguanylate cyclase (GGDEF)-like protein
LVEAHRFEFEDSTIPITISVGIAHLDASVKDPLGLLKAADDNLYKAKRSGRNRVCG